MIRKLIEKFMMVGLYLLFWENGDKSQTGMFVPVMLELNLEEVELDPPLYDTHSFRRVRAQYFVEVLRWYIPKICNWEGSALSGVVILQSAVANVRAISRKDYLNPEAKASLCKANGRSCNCGVY